MTDLKREKGNRGHMGIKREQDTHHNPTTKFTAAPTPLPTYNTTHVSYCHVKEINNMI